RLITFLDDRDRPNPTVFGGSRGIGKFYSAEFPSRDATPSPSQLEKRGTECVRFESTTLTAFQALRVQRTAHYSQSQFGGTGLDGRNVESVWKSVHVTSKQLAAAVF
uniref:Uncharacterized protein n=1 Tax=Caenorhabditis japonica TaxID=281687 RepID=A0A8R1EBT9_CAEJA